MARKKATAETSVADGVEFTPDALAIRTCNKDGSSYSGFIWPLTVGSIVTAPDWNARAECGGGLHGLLDGIGDWELTARDDAVWQVVGVKRSECVDIEGGKVKFPRCRVEYVGGFAQAMQMVQKATVTKILEMAQGNTATGDSGHAAATGDRGHAAATGYSGHAAATGKFGISASLGWKGTAQAGVDGAIALAFWNDKFELVHVFASRVGENGIEAGKTYRLNADGKPVLA